MTKSQEPLEPTQVYDSTPSSVRQRALRAAAWLRSNSDTAYRTIDERTRVLRDTGRDAGSRLSAAAAGAARAGGPVDRTEQRIHGLLNSVERQIEGRGAQAAGLMRAGVSRGADATRRLLRAGSSR